MLGRRHANRISFGYRIGTGPKTLHLLVAYIHAELSRFAIVLIEKRRVFLHRKVYEDGIPINACLIDVAIAKKCLHQVACYLIEECTIWKRLHYQGLALHIDGVYGRVVGEDIDFFSQNLPVVTPCDGVAIERKYIDL